MGKRAGTQTNRLKGDAGEGYIDLVVKAMAVMVFAALLIQLPGPFIKYQNLSYACRTVTRCVEAAGKVDAQTWDLVAALGAQAGFTPSVSYTGLDGDGHVQLRQRFSVTMEVTHRVTLLDTRFGAPLAFDIPIRVTNIGVGEVYWKRGGSA